MHLVESIWNDGVLEFIDLSKNVLARIGTGGFQAYKKPVTAKTANYTVTAVESGGVFTNVGASGAVTFTLPAAAAGLNYTFICQANQNLLVALTGKLVYINDIAANSVAFQTTNEKIGGIFTAVSDGTYWYIGAPCPNTVTVTT